MSFVYESNTVRWKKYCGVGDIRRYRPAKGWSASADLIEYHPITGKQLRGSQWWIREVKEGQS